MRLYIPPELQEEHEKLNQMFIDIEEDLTAEEFTEKYASEEYKRFFREREKERKQLWEQGIIVN